MALSDGSDGPDEPIGLARHGAAFRGALAFLTRLPVGHRDGDWAAFRTSPVAFPLAGYVVGGLLALPVLILPAVGFPAPVVAATFLAWVYLVTGINHVDGLADLGDAAVVHGGRERRLDVLKDTTVGVGAVLAVSLAIAGLGLAGLGLAGLASEGSAAFARPLRLAGIVVAAEVGAKLGMAAIAALGSAATEGLGADISERTGPRSLVLPAVVASPAVVLSWPSPAAGVALLAAVAVAILLWRWARRTLGGVNGDVMGAGNELGRVVGLHAGVIAWTLS